MIINDPSIRFENTKIIHHLGLFMVLEPVLSRFGVEGSLVRDSLDALCCALEKDTQPLLSTG